MGTDLLCNCCGMTEQRRLPLPTIAVTDKKGGFSGSLRELRLETMPFPKREKNDL